MEWMVQIGCTFQNQRKANKLSTPLFVKCLAGIMQFHFCRLIFREMYSGRGALWFMRLTSSMQMEIASDTATNSNIIHSRHASLSSVTTQRKGIYSKRKHWMSQEQIFALAVKTCWHKMPARKLQTKEQNACDRYFLGDVEVTCLAVRKFSSKRLVLYGLGCLTLRWTLFTQVHIQM